MAINSKNLSEEMKARIAEIKSTEGATSTVKVEDREDAMEAVKSKYLRPMPEAPLDAFTAPVRKVLEETATAYRVPNGLAVSSLLGAVACCIGRTRSLVAKEGFVVPGNLWIANIAPSGLGKSHLPKYFFNFLAKKDGEYALENESAMAAYTRKKREYEFILRKSFKDRTIDVPPEPTPPGLKRFLMDDTTPEFVSEALRANPRGITFFVDELPTLFDSFSRYTKGGTDGGFENRLMTTFDGGSWRLDRINKGRCFYIPHACASMFGGIQTDVFMRRFNVSHLESGFLERMILLRFEIIKPIYWNERVTSKETNAFVETLINRLTGFDFIHINGTEESLLVGLSDKAKKVFVKWTDKQIALGYEDHCLGGRYSWYAKAIGLCLRICLLLHCIEQALEGNDGRCDVCESTMIRAISITEWIRENQRQVNDMLVGGCVPASPLERAIMKAVVEEANRRQANNFVIANADLAVLIQKTDPTFSIDSIGRAATKMGLPAVSVGNGRGRKVTEKKLFSFRRSVGSVGSVGNR